MRPRNIVRAAGPTLLLGGQLVVAECTPECPAVVATGYRSVNIKIRVNNITPLCCGCGVVDVLLAPGADNRTVHCGGGESSPPACIFKEGIHASCVWLNIICI